MPPALRRRPVRTVPCSPSLRTAGPTRRTWTSTMSTPTPVKVAPVDASRKPSRSLAKREKVASKPLNAVRATKVVVSSGARPWARQAARSSSGRRAACPTTWVSGSRRAAATAFTAARAAATRNGRRGPPRAARAPMAGPATNPRPKAAPRSPSSRARCSGGATSATEACATDTLAPEMPSRTRPRNSTHRAPANPVTRLPTAVPASERTRTGLRPMRSDTRPQNGENTSCAPEKAATRAAAMNDEAPNRLAYCGRIGRTIPNPTRSSATEDQIAPKPRGSGGRDPGTLTNERGTEAHVKSSLRVTIPGRSGTGVRSPRPGIRNGGDLPQSAWSGTLHSPSGPAFDRQWTRRRTDHRWRTSPHSAR